MNDDSTRPTAATRYHGMLCILRYNWHQYACAAILCVMALVAPRFYAASDAVNVLC